MCPVLRNSYNTAFVCPLRSWTSLSGVLGMEQRAPCTLDKCSSLFLALLQALLPLSSKSGSIPSIQFLSASNECPSRQFSSLQLTFLSKRCLPTLEPTAQVFKWPRFVSHFILHSPHHHLLSTSLCLLGQQLPWREVTHPLDLPYSNWWPSPSTESILPLTLVQPNEECPNHPYSKYISSYRLIYPVRKA